MISFQNFKNILQLMKEALFKHGEKEAIRSCVRAINFCSTESQGELQDFARAKLKDLEDEIVAKLKSAMKEVAVCLSLSFLSSPIFHMNKANMFQNFRMVVMSILFL